MKPTRKNCLKIAKEKYSKENFETIKVALEFAETSHVGQKRLSGEDYIIHPIATAITLMEINLEVPIVLAGLLHDVPEDTQIELEEIEKKFSKDVATIVDGVTKLGKVRYRGIERYAANLQKLFLAMAKDPRVVIVRFADRLHNLQNLQYHKPDKQKRIALEVLEIFVPIAHRLEMGWFRRQMEELAFKYAYPVAHKKIKKIANQQFRNIETCQKNIQKRILNDIQKENINLVELIKKPKSYYSIFKELPKVDNDITKIRDLIRNIYIVENNIECYSILGIIHKHWQPVKGNIRDFMTQPSPEGYRGLRTLVTCHRDHLIEFRTRTVEMEEQRKYGIILEWRQGNHKSSELAIHWLNELAEIQKEVLDYRKFLTNLESIKGDLLQRRILVFTPAGEMVDLPFDSTPIDFAYAIHTEVGNSFRSSRINGHQSKENQKLRDGDIVEIIVCKKDGGPKKGWLKITKTRRAKARIKEYFKKTTNNEQDSCFMDSLLEMKHPPIQMEQ